MLPPGEDADAEEAWMGTVSGTCDLDALAAPYGGIVTRTGLVTAGWSTSSIDRALAAGRLRRISAGVYRTQGAPWTRQASRYAALAMAGPGALLARASAVELHGLGDPTPGPHQLLIPHHRRPVRIDPALARVSRTRTLTDGDRVEVAEIPTTSVARTLLDIAATTDHRILAEFAARALQRNLVQESQLRDVLDRNPAARGRRRLLRGLELLENDALRIRSEVEVAAVADLVAAGLPRPEVGYLVTDAAGQPIAEVDLAYPRLRIAIEIDGFRWHSTPARKMADEQRQNRLVLAGWTVLRFSAAVVRKEPQVLVRAVRSALATR